MKALAKLGLLLAIIVAGRQLRPATPAALTAQPTSAALTSRPDTVQYDSFASLPMTPVTPVSHRTVARPAQDEPSFSIWN